MRARSSALQTDGREDSLDADEMGWDSSSSHGPCWSPGGSADTAMNSKGRRPRRACRKATDAVVQLQAEEEMEERRKVMDQRTFRLKEKNKRAQQRFRERQRQKSLESHAQLEQLSQEVAQYKARATAAEDRYQLLERVMAMRQEEIPEKKLSGDLKDVQKEALEKPENFEPYLGWLTVPEGNIVLVLRGRNPEHPLLLTREQVDEMTLHQHIHMWKDFVEQMAMALLDAQGDLNSAAGKHLQGLTNELFAYAALVNLSNPRVLPKMHSIKLEESCLLPRPDDAFYSKLLRSLVLSDDQVQSLLASRRFCLATLASLMRERHLISKTLADVVDGGSSWANMYSSHPAMVDASTRLARNVDAESRAFHTFLNSTARRVFNPIQTATVIVQSFPYMPNMMQLISVLSLEVGEPAQEDLLSLEPIPLQPPTSRCMLASSMMHAPSTSLLPFPYSSSNVLSMGRVESLSTTLDTLFDDIYMQ